MKSYQQQLRRRFLVAMGLGSVGLDASATTDCPGDSTADGAVNITDVVATVAHVLGTDAPDGLDLDGADINDDCVTDVIDVVSTVNLILTDYGAAQCQTCSIADMPEDADQLEEWIYSTCFWSDGYYGYYAYYGYYYFPQGPDQDLGPYMFCVEPSVDGTCTDPAQIDNYSASSIVMESVGVPSGYKFGESWQIPWEPDVAGCAVDTQSDACCYAFEVGLDDGVIIGRPLNIDGVVTLAPVCHSSQWTRECHANVSELTPAQRDLLVDGWLKAASEEHASIAAFARFTMELMALGAPPDLIASSTRAQADEISHARSSFAIASRIASTDYGPGPLNIAGALPDKTDIADVLVATIFEGCVGETIAAAESAWLSEQCNVPEIQKVHKQIASDEARHAGLGWKTVRWIIQQRPDLKPMASAAFTQARAQLLPKEHAFTDDAWLAQWGRMPSKEGHQLIANIWATVISPCADALLNTSNEDLAASA